MIVGHAIDRGRNLIGFEQSSGAGTSNAAAVLSSTLRQSSHRSNASGGITTGMRWWIGCSVLLASVVMTAAVSSLLAVRAGPAFPQPGERDRAAVCRPHHIGPPRRRVLVPFVEAVGRDQTAAPLHGVPERRLVEHRIAARLQHQRECLGILDPGRNQTPTHQRELPLALIEPHDRNRLRRRHVVARREIRLFRITRTAAASLPALR